MLQKQQTDGKPKPDWLLPLHILGKQVTVTQCLSLSFLSGSEESTQLAVREPDRDIHQGNGQVTTGTVHGRSGLRNVVGGTTVNIPPSSPLEQKLISQHLKCVEQGFPPSC